MGKRDPSGALLFSSHFERLRLSAQARPPLRVPSRYAHLAPLPPNAMVRGWKALQGKQHARCHAIAANLHAVSQRWSPSAQIDPPKYHPLVKSPPSSEVKFDNETWVTDVTETAEFCLPPDGREEALNRFFEASSPQNWARPKHLQKSNDFYKGSEPGYFRDGKFNRSKGDEVVWRPGHSTDLRERVEWEASLDGRPASATVILRITNYTRQQKSLYFKFMLRKCVNYSVASGAPPDILDIDEGHFEAHVDVNTLRVSASKRLHFSAPDSADTELADLLNLLSPALGSVLMRELVYEGTLRALGPSWVSQSK